MLLNTEHLSDLTVTSAAESGVQRMDKESKTLQSHQARDVIVSLHPAVSKQLEIRNDICGFQSNALAAS